MDFLSWEVHAEGLAGYFSRNKTIEAICHIFYWPMNISKIVGQYCTCQLAKQQKQIVGPYTPLSVPSYPWQNMSLDFILGLPKIQKNMTSS